MGNTDSYLDEEDTPAPPPPARSRLFVVRNGRYEPQNLMPVMPRSDMMDFDGFNTRRGPGGLMRQPPELRQVGLTSNPASLRRESIVVQRQREQTEVDDNAEGGLDPFLLKTVDLENKVPDGEVKAVLSCTVDALCELTLSLHVLCAEYEELDGDQSARIQLVMREDSAPYPTAELFQAPAFHTQSFDAGIGQLYTSPPIDLSEYTEADMSFDAEHPRLVPIAIRLEGCIEGQAPCIQYTYIALQSPKRASLQNADAQSAASPMGSLWTTQVVAQKLQFGERCFVLHELFGVGGKLSDTAMDESGGECIICFVEPRDTAVLPCRHMCFCRHCAGIVRLQCDKCPVCRTKVQKLLQFRRDGKPLNPALVAGATHSAQK